MRQLRHRSKVRPGRPALRTALQTLLARRRPLARLLVLLLLTNVANVPVAQETTVIRQDVILPERECQLKYAYLYSFSLMANWPDSAFATPASPFVIGVYGEKDFGELLDRLAMTKKVRGRHIEIRRLKKSQESRRCHVLYITSSVTAADREALLNDTKRQPVLIVGESQGFQQHGAVINFYFADDSVRFYLNLDEADRRQLSMSARLSKVATVVRDNQSSRPTGVAGP